MTPGESMSNLRTQSTRTWDEAARRWLQETSHKKTHSHDIANIRWFDQFFKGKLLTELTKDLIYEVGEIKRQEYSATTANRYLALVRAILRRAMLEWEWIERVPHIRLYPVKKTRVRWLKPEQMQALFCELPEHLADIVRFSLATGLRKSNALALEWSQIDIARNVAWIYADQAKGGRDIHISLNGTALEVLQKRSGTHPKYVFTYKGAPILQVNTRAWRKALRRAGIDNFRWHDLRHTWASWLIQSGVPLEVLQEMGAWQSPEMVKRYAHFAPEKFRKYAVNVDVMLEDAKASQSDPVIF